MSKPILDVRQLTVTYDAFTAVDNLSFSLEKGEIISIVGESGSGKSTCLRALMGLLSNEANVSGAVYYKDKELLGDKKTLRALCGKELAMIFQQAGAYMHPHKKIAKQFDLFLKEHGMQSQAARRQHTMDMLEKVHLKADEHVLCAYPAQLSGGMQQRVAIALAMSFQPDILLADEPTSALDVTTQLQIVKVLKELAQTHQTAIILVTHHIGVAAYLSDKMIVMQNGAMVEYGMRDTILFNATHPYTKQLLQAAKFEGNDWHE